MKNVVFSDIGREVEFKPDLIFEKYLKMAESDVRNEFIDRTKLKEVDCPACKSSEKTKDFLKFEFEYVECKNCGTIYMSPRPDDAHIKEHFLNSASACFWRDTLSKATDDKRREKIYYPRMQWIIGMGEEYLSDRKNIADFNSRNVDYISGLLSNCSFDNKFVVNPYFNLSDVADDELRNNLNIAIDYDIDSIGEKCINMATAFEVIDYTSNIDAFMETINNMLCKGGLCFITTISITGFDLQVLWDNSKSILPLDRINVFSQKGLKILFERHGFEMLEYSTPGVLDFDIVEDEFKKNPNLNIPRFVKTMLERNDEQLKQDFQTFLQVNRLSSFVRILLKKI